MTPELSPCDSRFGASESSSSKKTMQGADCLAFEKRRRIFASLSPMYIFKSSGPLTDTKFKLHSVAMAFAHKVLPVPGGPYNIIPLFFLLLKKLGKVNGRLTIFIISNFTSFKPPTSPQRTLGIFDPLHFKIFFNSSSKSSKTSLLEAIPVRRPNGISLKRF
eukprot:NODE_659_length_4968_cov_0.490655.p4 type:complete len:162 gc:universal NODE_659_length_4968_cov_0.490655:502-987(+)